jgi:hypothetical protein
MGISSHWDFHNRNALAHVNNLIVTQTYDMALALRRLFITATQERDGFFDLMVCINFDIFGTTMPETERTIRRLDRWYRSAQVRTPQLNNVRFSVQMLIRLFRYMQARNRFGFLPPHAP